ncbi:MAG: hypothetical protein IJW12_02345 [Opitutales bacterium]|nr:hypothetical protein [Opitutales bacterium]
MPMNTTLVQTSTGTWTITYNAENRPIRFENAGTQTVVECVYDSQGRRFEKKVSVAGTIMPFWGRRRLRFQKFRKSALGRRIFIFRNIVRLSSGCRR